MRERRSKPEEWPGAVVRRVNLRPLDHAAINVGREVRGWLSELYAEYHGDYFVKHLVVSVDTRDGKPKGLRYSARVVLWPRPNSTRNSP